MNNALDPTNCERNDEKILIQSVAIIMPSIWIRNKYKVYDLSQLATGHFGRNGWRELPERSLRSRRTLTEVLFDCIAFRSESFHSLHLKTVRWQGSQLIK
jgi:hypothetical protein